MKSLEEYLALAAESYGHRCPGQVLGVRMAMLGLRELGIDDPAKHHKRLLAFVEIDRCAVRAPARAGEAEVGGFAGATTLARRL
jgi:formylmethanofuran dehydrogenase subunit E